MFGMQVLSISSFVVSVSGHGYVLDPPPRSALRIKGNIKAATGSCVGGICYWFSQGCTIGCHECTGKVDFLPDTNFINHCKEQAPATLPYYARTWQNGEIGGLAPPLRKKCGISPWCAPGSSPVMGPCGTACGGPGIALLRQGLPPAGFKCNDDARILPPLDVPKPIWKVGSIVEAQFALAANHGGGYQYRLCPMPSNYGDLTEECFEQMPLDFYGDQQQLQFCEKANSEQFPPFNPSPKPFPECEDNRINVTAVDVKEGTIPVGSTWRRNPIPGCINGAGVLDQALCGFGRGTREKDFMFPPPGSDPARSQWQKLLGGYGVYSGVADGGDVRNAKKYMFQFNIVDKLVVPKVAPGDYVLQWRWDCEMAPQIWLSCSDVTITDDKANIDTIV